MKPNLNRIIEDNLDKAKFQSKLQPSLPKNTGWLDGYADGGLLSKKVTCSNCGWSWKAVDGGIDPMTCHKCGGTIKMKHGGSYNEFPEGGPVSSSDSLRHQAGKMFDFEFKKGSPTGGSLTDWGYHKSQLPDNKKPKEWKQPENPKQAVDLYMQEIGNNPILGYFPSAMEKGEAGDFLYNTGRDARVYMLDQYLKSKGQAGIPNRGSYNVDTKTDKWTPLLQKSLDDQWNQYSTEINKLPVNTRRQLLNKGRDFYYQNTYSGNPGDGTEGITNWGFNADNTPKRGEDGSLSPAYGKTWKPRIWESVNTYKSGGTYISGKALATQFGQYPEGGQPGKKQPLIVNDKNDPRLKAYNDSLSLYNSGKEYNKKTYDFTSDNLLHFQPISEIYKYYKGKISEREKEYLRNNIVREEHFKNGHWDDKSIKNQKLFNGMAKKALSTNNIPIGNYSGEGYFPAFKKPVQPVVYQKDKPSFKDFVKTANPDYMSDDYDLEAAYKNLPEKNMKAWAKDPEKNHLPDTYKKPNHPTFSKESVYYKPGMEAGTWSNDVYIPNRGQIAGRENNLQVAPETGLIDRSLQRINTQEQPTNYSFHYPIEGTFERANPQGVKYFKDKAEWQNFLDENDYNSAEERNGQYSASGTLKKGKYGGWLSKYDEGGPTDKYVPITMPDLRHPGEGSVYQHIDRTIPLMGSTVPNNPDIVRKIEKEKAANEIALRKQASQVMKQKGNTHFTFPNGDYKPYKDMNFRERSYVEGLALDQDTRLNKDEDSVLDFFNPLHLIGSMGKGLAQAPYVAKQTDSYLPYVTGIGNPLLMGRMIGSESMNPLSSKMWTNEISNKAFLNSLALGIPEAVEKIPSTLKNAERYLAEKTPLKNFSKNFKTNILESSAKKPEYHNISFRSDEAVEKGIQESRNTIETEGKKILEDLNSTEGRSRLKNQFKLANPSLNEDQLQYLINTRLKEVTNSFHYNQPKFYQEVVSNNPVYNKQDALTWRNYVYPKKNAHWSSENKFIKSQNAPESLFPNNKSISINENNPSVINLEKKSGYDIFTDPNYSPGSVTLGEGLENNIVVLDHEGGHAIQKGGVMPIDTQLQELVRSKNPFDNIFQKSLNKESKKDRNYFRTAGNRTYKNEGYPFLVEQRKRMIEDGILKNRYDEVTPLKLLKARLNASKNVNENFIEGNRLIKITPPWKYNKLAKIMNTAPAVIPAIGVGTAAALNEEKYGGDISIPNLNNNWLSKYIKNK
jgi:hypothetical protein